MVLYAMACARLPFSDEDMNALAKGTYQGKIKFSKRVSKGVSVTYNFYINVRNKIKTFDL